MSKNLTRKGLAFGAVVALGSSLFAGTPAFAAAGINLNDVNEKGNYKMLEGGTFTLLASANSDFNASNVGQLRVQVKNLDGADASGFKIALGTGSLTALTADNDVVTLAGSTDEDVASTAGETAVFAIEGGSDGVSGMVSPFKFQFSVASVAADANARFEVKVWADADNDGVIDTAAGSEELVSATRTVSFLDITNVTSTIVIDDAIEGAGVTGADVTLPGVAIDQLTAAEWGVKFSTGTGAAIGTGDIVDAVTLSTDKTKFETDLEFTGATLAENSAVKAQVQFQGTAIAVDGVDNVNVGAAVTKSVVALKAAAITPSLVAGKGLKTAAVSGVTGTVEGNFRNDVEFKLEAVVEDDTHGATTADPVAGNKVSVAAAALIAPGSTALTLSSTVYVEINGVKYTDVAKLPGASGIDKLSLTTDAKGKVALTVKAVGFDGDGTGSDALQFTFTTETLTAVTAELEAADPTYTGKVRNVPNGTVLATDGEAVSLEVVVIDQYGGVPADEYNARATFNNGTSSNDVAQATTAATSATSTYAAIVSGKATLTVTDNGTGEGINAYEIDFIKRDTNGGYGSNSATDINFVNSANELLVKIVSAAAKTAGTVKLAATDNGTELSKNTAETAYILGAVAGGTRPAATQVVDFAGADLRDLLATAPSVVDGDKATIFGTVSTAATSTSAAAVISNATVTIAGAGLQFKVSQNGADVYGVGSLTFKATENGRFTVYAWSQKSGTQTVTITSGGASSKLDLKFLTPLVTAGSAWNVTVPATSQAGRTITFSAVLADKYGNVVDTDAAARDLEYDGDVTGTGEPAAATNVSLEYDGPGFATSTFASATDENGKIVGRVLLGASDAGLATFTLKYDANDDGDYADSTDLVVTKSVLVGVSATVSAAKKAASVSVKNAAGLSVTVVSGTKSVTKVATSDSFKVSLTKLTAGKKTVKVYVNDVLVASKSVTVKK